MGMGRIQYKPFPFEAVPGFTAASDVIRNIAREAQEI
jgi:hypothetical protein